MRSTENFLAEAPSVVDRRDAWRHRTKKWRKRELDGIRGLVVHQMQGRDSFDGLGRYHTTPGVHIGDRSGLPGIAYTFFVGRDGAILLCNDLEDITWSHGHAATPGDENKSYLGVCFGGKLRSRHWAEGTERPSDAQHGALLRIWHACADYFDLTGLDCYGHYHFGKPACPGDDLQSQVEEIRADLTVVERRVLEMLSTVRGRQEQLSRHGYSPGAIDGKWGPKSSRALGRFCTARGLPFSTVWSQAITAEMVRLA